MKRLLLIFSLLTIAFEVVAQSSKNTLEIDPASFRPVQTDALSGVAIDPIGLDRSKRPCARVKMHVNRMTRDEIANLEIRLPGGNVVLMKKTVAIEGNGLIFELTAKEQTRFYLHHEKYGDSNEVTVNLEPNKEYRIDAQLNLLLPITVVSNVKGADVYVDNVFKGVTNDSYMFTVDDVVPGNHKISIKYGASTAEQTVDVNSGNVSFRVEVNTATSRPQYVVFNLEPKYATIFVDGKPLTTGSTGVATTVLQNGIYSWRAIANGYHEQSGTFTVSGAKVVENVNLVIDAAMVTISAGDGVEIWVNNEKKGNSPWRGQLFSGTYIFEARKAGHRTTTLAQSITSNQPEQSYKLDTPTPIIGTINILSEPAMADVYVDGKKVGETPMFADVLVGEHTVELQLSGYSSQKQTVLVAEGKTASVNITLSKAPTKTYKVGDYYNDGKKEGVVFWVDETGKHGKIVSLTESPSRLEWSSDTNEQKRLIGANDKYNGANNMAKVKQISGWETKYPAFKWCADLGEGWYLPAIDELKIFTLDSTVYDAVNQTLQTRGKKLTNMGDPRSYWSSTERDYKTNSGEFCAWHVSMRNGARYYDKSSSRYVRAVAAVTFGESESKTASPASATPATQVAPSKTYKVGDYYNDGKKEGVVFWVDETGQHGKIVSLTESSFLQWSSDKYEQKRLIDADDNGDGAKNMAVVKQIPGWQSKYPAFKWCADLGEGWYLPAINELKIFTLDKAVHDAVNRTLETKGKKLANMGNNRSYWSSTEANLRSSGKFCAWYVLMYDGRTLDSLKYDYSCVRAVSAF